MVLWACTGGPAEPTASTVQDATSVLARADKADGTADHVVAKCAGCALGMDGNPLHAVTHEDYELHFCSETCAEGFSKDPEAVLGRLAP
jgi:hypothetical protein